MIVLQRPVICLGPVTKRAAGRVRSHEGVEMKGGDWSGIRGWKEMVMSAVVGMHWIYVSVFPDACWAVLNSPVASIPRTANAALRRSIPSFNVDVQEIQKLMEGVSLSLRIPQRKPWGSMMEKTETATKLAEDKFKMLAGVPDGKAQEALVLVNDMVLSLGKLQLWIDEQNADKVAVRVSDVLTSLSELKLLQTPGLPYLVPRAYSDQPRLVGRAIARLHVGINGSPDGPEDLEIVLDGYSSPLSSGAFASKITAGAFDEQKLVVDESSIVLRSNNKEAPRTLPLEIMPVGEFEPLYRTELDVQTGEMPVLPMSIFGSVSLSHARGGEEMSSSEEAFIFKFNRATAGLGGLAFDEGRFSVIGYVTKGIQTIQKLRTGDTILRAEIIKGRENLVDPSSSPSTSF